WTAWDEVGMAVRGGMKRLLSSRGVDLLPPAQGAGYALLAVEGGTTGEIVVAGALGDFEPRGPDPGSPPDQTDAAAPPAADSPVAGSREPAAPAKATSLPPLLDRILEEQPGQRLIAARALNPEADRFLSDHAIDGVPVLPGVVGLEILAQAASLLRPSSP